jgi:hypothetical protein
MDINWKKYLADKDIAQLWGDADAGLDFNAEQVAKIEELLGSSQWEIVWDSESEQTPREYEAGLLLIRSLPGYMVNGNGFYITGQFSQEYVSFGVGDFMMSATTTILRRVPEVHVGRTVKVPWSNGAGYSLYKVQDDPGSGPHWLQILGHYEICNDGTYELLKE